MESDKIMQEYVHFLFFTIVFADISCFFFSRARSTAGEGGTENISPRIIPLHDFRIPGLEALLTWSIRLGQKSSFKGNTSISM